MAARRLAVLALLLGATAGACGGKSNKQPEGPSSDGDSAGQPSDAGEPSGSQVGAGGGSQVGTGGGSQVGTGAGAASQAGAGEGGSPDNGMPDPGSTGSAGIGTVPSTRCSGPPTTISMGGCAAAFRNWTHDEETGICMPFIYGGCDATKNNYPSLADCQQACSGRGGDYDACEQASDCVLTASQCSGCFGQQLTTHDFVSYNQAYVGEVVPCPANIVYSCPDYEESRHFFVPTCAQGQCGVEDLRASDP